MHYSETIGPRALQFSPEGVSETASPLILAKNSHAPRTTSPLRLETHFPENKKNFKKFITWKLLVQERSSPHQKVQNYLKYFPYQFQPRPHMPRKSYQLPQTGASKNEKNLFLTGTKKIEKHFQIFFPIKKFLMFNDE